MTMRDKKRVIGNSEVEGEEEEVEGSTQKHPLMDFHWVWHNPPSLIGVGRSVGWWWMVVPKFRQNLPLAKTHNTI